MKSNQNDLLDSLDEIQQVFELSRVKREFEVEDWWQSLSIEDRERAFYAVCKRLYQGEIIDQGSYRYVLYDVFGFDPGMYVDGMNCGFMNIHNAIIVEQGDENE